MQTVVKNFSEKVATHQEAAFKDENNQEEAEVLKKIKKKIKIKIFRRILCENTSSQTRKHYLFPTGFLQMRLIQIAVYEKSEFD